MNDVLKKTLLIIGAGGDGMNLAEVIEELGEYSLIGFLDDDIRKLGKPVSGYPVVGSIEDAINYPTSDFVLLIGNSKKLYDKVKVRNRLAAMGITDDRFPAIINPHAYVSKHSQIGNGTIILPNVSVMANVKIGNFAFIASMVNIAHEVKIGDYAFLAPTVAIAGFSDIGEGAYLGMNASVMEGAVIGEWATVGMGSVVLADVPAYNVVVGNPAVKIKENNPGRDTNIWLREITLDDVNERYVIWLNDPDVTKYMDTIERPHTREMIKAHVDWMLHSDDNLFHAIMLNSEFIGTYRIGPIKDGESWVGVMIGEKNLWGEDYATDAHRATIAIAQRIGLKKLWAGVHIPNRRSTESFLKAGYVIDHYNDKNGVILRYDLDTP